MPIITGSADNNIDIETIQDEVARQTTAEDTTLQTSDSAIAQSIDARTADIYQAYADAPQLSELAKRRAELKGQRRKKNYILALRAVVMGGLAVGTFKLATSPLWYIRSAEQINIRSTEQLSADSLQAQLSIDYPQSLLTIETSALTNELEALPAVESATVNRQLVPPSLSVQIIERTPVAATVPDTSTPISTVPEDSVPFRQAGLIDASGYWMPLKSFSDLGSNEPAPALIVRGMRSSDVDTWQQIYPILSASPVTISTLDWSDPKNIILETEQGSVHLGAYSAKFGEQIQALDQLRSLSQQVDPATLTYIDLRNPTSPVIEVVPSANEENDLENAGQAE